LLTARTVPFSLINGALKNPYKFALSTVIVKRKWPLLIFVIKHFYSFFKGCIYWKFCPRSPDVISITPNPRLHKLRLNVDRQFDLLKNKVQSESEAIEREYEKRQREQLKKEMDEKNEKERKQKQAEEMIQAFMVQYYQRFFRNYY